MTTIARRQLGLLCLTAALALALAPTATAGDAAAGKQKYDIFCATCHGPLGKGDGPAAAAATPPPRDFSVGDFQYDTDEDGKAGSDADLRNIITHGAGKYGGNMLMAPWGGTLSGDDIENVIAYVRSLKK